MFDFILLAIVGIAFILILTFFVILNYRKRMSSKESLYNDIISAENDLYDDLKAMDFGELVQTKAGKELLNSIADSTHYAEGESELIEKLSKPEEKEKIIRGLIDCHVYSMKSDVKLMPQSIRKKTRYDKDSANVIIAYLIESSEHIISATGKSSALSQSLVQNFSEQASFSGKILEAMEEMVSITKLNSDNTEVAGKLIDASTTDKLKKATVLMKEIVNASREQSDGIDQISKAVQHLEQITQQSAANAEEAAAAGEELSAQAQNIKKLIGILAVQVDVDYSAISATTRKQLTELEHRISNQRQTKAEYEPPETLIPVKEMPIEQSESEKNRLSKKNRLSENVSEKDIFKDF